VKKTFRYAGLVGCFVAILAMSGGQWLALQTWAWTRMLVAFSQDGPLGEALIKTFDGRHPCPLCLKVQKGWAKDQQQEKKFPLLKLEKMPEYLWHLRRLTPPPISIPATDGIPFVPRFCSDFIDTPLTPPPRA
jgi:hypothetical protein